MYVFLNFTLSRFGLKHSIGVFISSEVSLCPEVEIVSFISLDRSYRDP